MLSANEIINVLADAARRKMSADSLEVLYAQLMTISNGDWTDEHNQRVLGIIQGIRRQDRNFVDDLTGWLELQDGILTIYDAYRDLNIKEPGDKSAARMVFHRLCERGLLEREGNRSGTYRKITARANEQRWWESPGEPLNVSFCLGIDMARLYPGNLILVEGSKSQGKTRFAIDFAKRNHAIFPGRRVRYLNVEMGDEEIFNRARAMERARQWTVAQFKANIEVLRVTEAWHDQIDPDGLNVVDYIVEYDEPYKVASHIFKIHQKMGRGLALIVVQRDPAKTYGSGGYAIRNIPRLIISLKEHTVKLEDVKSFVTTDGHNPSGKFRLYSMPGLWEFRPASDWTNPGDTPRPYERNATPPRDPDFEHEED